MAVQPKILTIPFARDATPDLVNEIPDDPNPLVPQSASWEQGFPYVTMIPLVAGGIPPQGQDFNGIMKAITEHTVFQGAGGFYKFDADVVAVGGYGLGAVLEADDGLSLWVSLVDNNVEDFNTGTPAQWRKISQGVPQTVNGSTTNASDADGHTHAVSLASETVAGVMEIATTAEAQAFTAGKAIDGAKLGDVLKNAPAFRATKSATQSITNAVNTKVTFDIEEFDTAGCFAASRFTPNVAGYYSVSVNLRLATNAAGTSGGVAIYKNGSAVSNIKLNYASTSGVEYGGLCINDVLYMNGTTDYIEAYAAISATNPFVSNVLSSFSGIMVRPE